MYDWPEVSNAHDEIWADLGDDFRKAGLNAPNDLSRSDGDSTDWLSPNLFLSQTCGYPFATRLIGRVQLLATPHYAVEGCSGPRYSSAIIVRKTEAIDDLASLKQRKLAINSRDSLSGFRCLIPLIGDPNQWFKTIIESGGHRNSANMVAQGRADCAAIDAVCWRLFQEYDAEAASHLKVMRWTPLLPALPIITNQFWSEAELSCMRSTLVANVNAPSHAVRFGPVEITTMSQLVESDYSPLALL